MGSLSEGRPTNSRTENRSAEVLLADHPFIRLRSSVYLAHVMDRELARMKARLNEFAEIDATMSITACVASGR